MPSTCPAQTATSLWLCALTIAVAALVVVCVLALRQPVTPAAQQHRPATVPPLPAFPPDPPRWYRVEYEAAQRAKTEGRLDAAQARIRDLIDASSEFHGAEHPYTRWAWDLRTAITQAAVLRLRAREAVQAPEQRTAVPVPR